MRRRVWLGAFVGLLLLSATLEAQYGWFTQNGGLIARMSSSAAAATIRQDGSGAILDLYDGATRVFRMADGGQGLFADGTAGAPSVASASWPANGMYFTETTVGFGVGGGQQAFVVGGAGGGFGIPAAKRLYYDGGGDTYATEDSSNVLLHYVGNVLVRRDTSTAIAVNVPLVWGNYAEPVCDSTTRGTVVLVQGGAGVADTFRICTKDVADAYAYRALY